MTKCAPVFTCEADVISLSFALMAVADFLRGLRVPHLVVPLQVRLEFNLGHLMASHDDISRHSTKIRMQGLYHYISRI